MPRKECFIMGTRPEIVKFNPLIDKIKPFVVFTGQQKELSKDIAIKYDADLECSINNGQTQASYLSALIACLDELIFEVKPSRIWVLGDTTSAYAGAIVAFLHKIELVHVEAGLRTNDKFNPYPEEMYRRTIDSMADILFAPTQLAVDNLENENIKGRVYLTGNTVVDSLENIKKTLSGFRPMSDKYVLATVHRRESFGHDMIEIFKALKELSKEIKVIIPEHSNPEVKKAIKSVGLQTVGHMTYPVFLRYLENCEYVLSDSGGVQEEAPSFNKKVVILRKMTERPEIVEKGYAILIKDMSARAILRQIKAFSKVELKKMINPFGDGHAADKIKGIIRNESKKKH